MCPIPKPPPSPASTVSASSSDKSPANSKAGAVDMNVYPKDWPKPGPIDLAVHDLPHFTSSLEWWYVNAHLEVVDDDSSSKKKKKQKKKKSKDKEGETEEEEKQPHQVSIFASFFRTCSYYDETKGEYVFVHSVAFSIMDHATEKYYNVSLLSPSWPELIMRRINTTDASTDDNKGDERLAQATKEVLEKGKVPYPDRLLKTNPLVMGKDLSRLPTSGKGYDDWMKGVGKLQEEEPPSQEQVTKSSDKAGKKKKKRGSCCFRSKDVLNSVSSSHRDLPALTLVYDENTFVKNKDGSYTVHVEDNEVHHVKASLTFTPNTGALRNGNNGIVDGDDIIQDFFYYCLPNCSVTGSVTLPNDEKPDRNNGKILRKNYFVLGDDEEKEPVVTTTHKVKGTGWYDHEFGAKKPDASGAVNDDNKDERCMNAYAYAWFSLQLDNGYQICCSEYFLIKDGTNMPEKPTPQYFGVLFTPDGDRIQLDTSDMELVEKGERWVSMRTFRDYAVEWTLNVRSKNIQIGIKAKYDQQEFPTLAANPAFWEGIVEITGTFGGKEVAGKGIVENKGFCPPETYTMQHFFKTVSRETLKSVKNILPFNPEGEKLNEMVCHKDNHHYTQHIHSGQFSKALVEPIRAVLDRGGKSWRSYAALACCDIVGGNSQPCKDWLALPELMHVGSLIVDDVEDRSTVRRGGPCSHIMYGEDVAINAGTMAYFLGQIVIYQGDGDDKQKVEIYNMYFEGMRAAHSGQAMDIHGLDYMMPEVVEHGGDLCRQRVVTIHRLKSAAPVSFFARLGGKLGGGSKAQSEALGAFFEALGIAFQIVDDVLNLRGFMDGLKTRGEDITAGKVTYPIAFAMNRLEKKDRAKLWEIVSSKPEDIETIGKAVALVEKVNAIDDSYKEAKTMIEEGWKKFDPLFVDSMVKVNLRAFSLYVLDRTY